MDSDHRPTACRAVALLHELPIHVTDHVTGRDKATDWHELTVLHQLKNNIVSRARHDCITITAGMIQGYTYACVAYLSTLADYSPVNIQCATT
uniref:Transposase n=1 Tax=Panagrellus redivivus TaxID=6233 RepID=A0A7E4VD38_PANRE